MTRKYEKSSVARFAAMGLVLFGVGISQAQAESVCKTGWKVISVEESKDELSVEIWNPAGEEQRKFVLSSATRPMTRELLVQLATIALHTGDSVDILVDDGVPCEQRRWTSMRIYKD